MTLLPGVLKNILLRVGSLNVKTTGNSQSPPSQPQSSLLFAVGRRKGSERASIKSEVHFLVVSSLWTNTRARCVTQCCCATHGEMRGIAQFRRGMWRAVLHKAKSRNRGEEFAPPSPEHPTDMYSQRENKLCGQNLKGSATRMNFVCDNQNGARGLLHV